MISSSHWPSPTAKQYTHRNDGTYPHSDPGIPYSGGTINFVEWSKPETSKAPGYFYPLLFDQTSDYISMDEFNTFQVATDWDNVEKGNTTVEMFVEKVRRSAHLPNPNTIFREAIQVAIQNEAINVARLLVKVGLQDYPDSTVLRNYEKALAPPKVIKTGTRAGRDYSKSMQWLSAHSHEYVGQWVALRDGELIDKAASRKLLIELIGDASQEPNVLLSRIPRT